ncbi:MAG: T9SS type A sorting domain-containing protein [Bacteroidia bacterium]
MKNYFTAVFLLLLFVPLQKLQAQSFFFTPDATNYNLSLGGNNMINLNFDVGGSISFTNNLEWHQINTEYQVELWDPINQLYYTIGDFNSMFFPAKAFQSPSPSSNICNWVFASQVPGWCTNPNATIYSSLDRAYTIGCGVPSGVYELRVRITKSEYTLNSNPASGQAYQGMACSGPNTNCIIPNLATINWINPNGLNASISPNSLNLCIGECKTVTANVSGGTPPYSYNWIHTYNLAGTAYTHNLGSSSNICFKGKSGNNQALTLQVSDALGCNHEVNFTDITVRTGRKACVFPQINGCCQGPSSNRTSIKVDEDAILLYPKKEKKKVHITSNTAPIMTIRLLNTNGQIMKEMKNPDLDDRYSFSVGDLSAGIYLVEIITSWGIEHKKLVVQK